MSSDIPHPLLGPEWAPLVAALADLSANLAPSTFWRMDTYAAAHGFDPNRSPYAQARLADTGELQVEVRGNSRTERAPAIAALALLGWFGPSSDAADSIPNAHRLYPQGWNPRSVATSVLEALAMLFELAPRDVVTFGSSSRRVRESNVLQHLDGDTFVIAASELSDEENDRALALDPDLDGEEIALADLVGYEPPVDADSILARLAEADILHDADDVEYWHDSNGRSSRTGYGYQVSTLGGRDIVGLKVDVQSWEHSDAVDWIQHLEHLNEKPAALITGALWSIAIAPAQPDASIPAGLASEIADLIPNSWVQWSHQHDPVWFTPLARSAAELSAGLTMSGLDQERRFLRSPANTFAESCLKDGSALLMEVLPSKDGRPVPILIFIEDNWAAEVADSLRSSWPSVPGAVTVAGDGWAIRVDPTPQSESVAQNLADRLRATYSDSDDIRIVGAPSWVDTRLWGPMAESMKALLMWTSRNVMSTIWDELEGRRLEAWGRARAAVTASGRQEGLDQALLLLELISTNDFFDHAGAEALTALCVRDLLDRDDYELLTRSWRCRAGRLHSDDPVVPLLPEHARGVPMSKYELEDSLSSVEAIEAVPITAAAPTLSTSRFDEFDSAVEIMARLIEAGLIDSAGMPLLLDEVGHPVTRQGVSYQHSHYSDNDIVGWVIDVTSWSDGSDPDWVDHVSELDGPRPISIIIGPNWVLSVQRIMGDSTVPEDLDDLIREAVGGGLFIRRHDGFDPEWFTCKYRRVQDLLDRLEERGEVTVSRRELTDIVSDPDPYLVECLEDDSFAIAALRSDAGSATIAILLEDNWAEQAADALSNYLPPKAGATALAGDGWVVRVLAADGDRDSYSWAADLARILNATYADFDLPTRSLRRPFIDLSSWGPQAERMKAMINLVTLHLYASSSRSLSPEVDAARRRAFRALQEAERFHPAMDAAEILRSVSRNDFFNGVGVETILGLCARDLISPADYDLMTSLWRTQIGPIHPDDELLPIHRRARLQPRPRGRSAEFDEE